MKIGLVVPHVFMQRELLDRVIFSPGSLALSLADGLVNAGHEVTLFSPGPVDTLAKNITADLTYFKHELKIRGDTYLDLLKKHPLTFITLSRQVQSELITRAYKMANDNDLDIVHIYTNEEDTALPFSVFCQKPVIFTHHDPFNLLVHYNSVFPKYPHLNWLSISLSQRKSMPTNTNWIANIYHGLKPERFRYIENPKGGYVAYLGRIIESKGVDLAISAIKLHNATNPSNPLKLKIAGKHYASRSKNKYWEELIEPEIDGDMIEYVGHLKDDASKQDFIGNALGLIVPSMFEEPFGMVTIEAFACGTPVIGLDSGALPEIIKDGKNGYLVAKSKDKAEIIQELSSKLSELQNIDRSACRNDFEARFTLRRMCSEHIAAYEAILTK